MSMLIELFRFSKGFQLGSDALWKLKAYVSPFSPGRATPRRSNSDKRKATPELFEVYLDKGRVSG